jgi:polysaccharide export outer membrane protein
MRTSRSSLGLVMTTMRTVLAVALAIVGSIGAASAVEADYTLNPGDVLQITVWKEEGLDRETLILPDGSLSFPFVGSLTVVGHTVSQVRDEIKARLDPFLPDASVTVSVKAALGHAVSVIGQVGKPGELVAGHRITVMQALSMAGGLTPYASHSDIIILRRGGAAETAIPFPYDEVIRGRKLDRDIVLLPGDVVVVPTASLF